MTSKNAWPHVLTFPIIPLHGQYRKVMGHLLSITHDAVPCLDGTQYPAPRFFAIAGLL